MQLLKCALILALLGAACAGSTPVARTTHASLNEDTQDCELCKIVITTLEQYVRDPSVQQSVQDSLNGIICSELPASMRASCTEEIRVMVVEVAAAVISVLPPSRVCSQLGVCSTPAGPAALLAVPHNGPLDCPMCRILVASLVARLRDPAARRELEREAHAACAASAASPASCSAHVTALFEAADAVLADLDPEKACEIANICEPWAAGEAGQAAKGSEGALVQTTSLARAAQDAELLASLAASRWAARAQEGALAGSGDVFCKDCMALATQLQAALRDPELQADVLASLASWCAAVPAFQAGCEQGLRDAGREVLQALVAALEPRDVCGALQLCPARAELRAGLALAAHHNPASKTLWERGPGAMSDSDTSSYDSEEERFRARQAQYAELARIAAVSAAQRGTLHRIQAERAAREAVEAAAYSERLRQGRGSSHPGEDGCAFSNGAASSSRWGEDAAAGPVFPPSPAAPLRLVRMHEEAWALLSKRRLPVRFEDVPWPPCAPEAYVRAQLELELELEQDWAQRRKGRAEGAAAVPKKIARRAWARLSLRWHPDSIARRVEIAEEDRPRVLQEAARVMAQLNQAREKLGQE